MSTLVQKRRERKQGFSNSGPLQKFFHPRCVAVIGATETPGAVGSTVFQNLVSSGFKGRVYPVNPKRPSIHGHKAFPNIAAVPEQVDLAVIVTPAQSVPGLIRECGDVGITNTVIISAGFKEIGEAGVKLEQQVLAEAREAGMRIIGPNCLGVMSPHRCALASPSFRHFGAAIIRSMSLHSNDVKEEQLPKLAIRPYPAQYVHKKKLQDSSNAVIRPIRPEDEPAMIKFHESLSEASVYYRYFGALKLEQRISHERLARICFNDYDREIALVIDRQIPGSEEHEILGVARLSRVHGTNEAEFAIIITDKWQGKGLGVELTNRIQEVARGEGVQVLRAVMLPENREMQRLAEKAGFEIERHRDGEVVAELALN